MITSLVASTPVPYFQLPAFSNPSRLHHTCYFHYLPIRRCLPSFNTHLSLRNSHPAISAVTPSNKGAIPVMDFEDFMEKDWSFLDSDHTRTAEVNEKIERILSAGKIEGSSMVLVSISSEEFVDKLVDSSPCQQLLVVHDSLLTLACIKEKYDKVNCWQGELINLPEKWASFDVMFLYFLPSLPFDLDQVFGTLAGRYLPGARLVISHLEGREVLEQQRRQYPEVIVSDLPDKLTLENAAAGNSFEVVEFVDEAGFYLAVLKFKGKC